MDFPIKNGDFPLFFVCLPEGTIQIADSALSGSWWFLAHEWAPSKTPLRAPRSGSGWRERSPLGQGHPGWTDHILTYSHAVPGQTQQLFELNPCHAAHLEPAKCPHWLQNSSAWLGLPSPGQGVSPLTTQVHIPKTTKAWHVLYNGPSIASWLFASHVVFAGGTSTGIPPKVSPFNYGRWW